MVDWSLWPPRAVDDIASSLLRAGIMDSIYEMESRRIMPTEMLFGTGMTRFWDRWTLNTHRFAMPPNPLMGERDRFNQMEHFLGMPIRHRAIVDRPERDPLSGVEFSSEIRIAAHGFGSLPVKMMVRSEPSALRYGVVVEGWNQLRRVQDFSYTMMREMAMPQQEMEPVVMQSGTYGEKAAPSTQMTPTRIAWLT